MEEYKTRFGIKIDNLHPTSQWSLGVCLSHFMDETYLYINLFFISIAIGRLSLPIKDNGGKL